MRIVHFVLSLGIGGIETMLVNIANEQCKCNVVDIVILNNIIDKDLVSRFSREINLHYINREIGSWNLFYFLRCNMTIIKLNPDIVHCHWDTAKYIPFVRCPKVLTVHNTNLNSNIKKYSSVFSISKAVNAELCASFPRSISFPVILNGIDTTSFQIRQFKEVSNYKFCQIGRLTVQKNQVLLLDAINILVYEMQITNFHLDFIGDGELLPYLSQKCNSLELEGYCSFIGPRSNSFLKEHLKDYDLLIMPSRYEGFGLTVVEAMAARVPVLVADIEGPMEIIDNGRFGAFFESENARDCADKIAGYIKGDQISEAIVDHAHKHVLDNFDVKVTAQKYLNAYRDIIN